MRRRRRVVTTILLVAPVTGVLIFAWGRHARLYTVTVLPRVGTQVVVPCSINDRGQIVGVCQGRFYLWEPGKDWREMGRASEGLRINNAGQIAGTVEDPNGDSQAFLWDPNEGLTLLGIGMSIARAMNNRGQIVGQCWNNTGRGDISIWSKTQGVRFMGGSYSGPVAMNDAGQIIGHRGSREPLQPVLWETAEDGSSVETLAPSGALHDINNRGYVLGSGFHFDKQRQYAFLWRQGHDIEWLFPLENLMARVSAVNDGNQVTVCEEVHSGWLERLIGRRFRPYKESSLWTRERGRVFLDGYVLDQRGEFFHITDLNNRGCIIGTIQWKTGDIRRAVLLEPIPERWGGR